MTQFTLLEAEFPEVFALATKAELLATTDARGACFHARLALEAAVKWMYSQDNSLRTPYDTTLSALIHDGSFRALVGNALVTKARIIKDYGNAAAHDSRPVPPANAIIAVRELFHFSYWLVRTYARGAKPQAGLTFDQNALPRAVQVEASTLAKLQALAKERESAAKALEAAAAARIKNEQDALDRDAEIARLQAEIAAIKQANASTPDTHDYNEEQTRDLFIDLLLREAGWTLAKPEDREFPVTGMPNSKDKGFVDYVLWGDDGKPLALVEAKRTKRDPRVGQQQAKLYADCLEKQFGQRPVIFYSNGYDHWIWDDLNYPPREVQGFYKKDELALLIQRRGTKKALSQVEIDTQIVERYYQSRAIRRIGEAFEKDHFRKALVVMATGAGKTRTVIALVDLMLRANWVKRVLFLADRVALVNQAVKAFKSHLPTTAPVNLVTEKSAEGRVYVSTYPTMMGLINEKDEERRFGPGHFDLIIIDEAHRSVYQKYGAIFEYFDSYLVGLTATPKDEIDKNTYRLFNLESGVPTDVYSLDQAVDDKFLVPPKAISVPLKFQREGIRYDDLSEEEKDEWDAVEWEDGAIPNAVDAAAVNKWLFNTDTVDKVLETLMIKGIKVAGGDRLGKTIIFAKNHDHAKFIGERFDANYPHYKGHFARVVDYETSYVQSIIDDFSNLNKAPHIAISVDMLDTGIDVPEVVNLVFFKVVRSKTKFWQMIGRGTRLCKDLFGPGDDKKFFAIFDFCQNLEFFSQNTPVVESAAGASLSKRLFTARLALIGELDKKLIPAEPLGQQAGPTPQLGAPKVGVLPANEGELLVRKDLSGWLMEEVSAMNLDNFVIRPKRKFVEKYRDAAAWVSLPEDAVHELIENVAGLPSSHNEDDEEAKRFDLLVFRTELAVLRAEPGFARLKLQIQDIASALESISSIPMIQAELTLIQDVQTDEYWTHITVPLLEVLRKRLRTLVKLVEKTRKKIVYTDFEDELGEGAEVELIGASLGMDFERFKMKAQHFLKDHESHVAIQRLRRNQPLTPTDLDELEKMLKQVGDGAAEHVAKVRERGLGLFVRSLVGMERAAAVEALAEFLKGRTMTPNQHEFIEMIVGELTQNGAVEARRLYEAPFIDLHSLGVDGIFPEADVTRLIEVLEQVRIRAA